MDLKHVKMIYKQDQNLHKISCHFVDGNLDADFMLSHNTKQLITMIIEDYSPEEVVAQLQHIRENEMYKKLFLSMMCKEELNPEDKVLYENVPQIFNTYFEFLREYRTKQNLLNTIDMSCSKEQGEVFGALFTKVVTTVKDAIKDIESVSFADLLPYYGEKGVQFHTYALEMILGTRQSSVSFGKLPSADKLEEIVNNPRSAMKVAIDPDSALFTSNIATAIVCLDARNTMVS